MLRIPFFNFFKAMFLNSKVDAGMVQLYSAKIDMVLQKNESCTFSSVNPNNFSSCTILGGVVFKGVCSGSFMGSSVYNLTGSYFNSLSNSILCTSSSKSKHSGIIFSPGFPTTFCAKTAPKTPDDVAASTQSNFSAFSSIKFPNNGSDISIFFICSKATFCSSVA